MPAQACTGASFQIAVCGSSLSAKSAVGIELIHGFTCWSCALSASPQLSNFIGRDSDGWGDTVGRGRTPRSALSCQSTSRLPAILATGRGLPNVAQHGRRTNLSLPLKWMNAALTLSATQNHRHRHRGSEAHLRLAARFAPTGRRPIRSRYGACGWTPLARWQNRQAFAGIREQHHADWWAASVDLQSALTNHVGHPNIQLALTNCTAPRVKSLLARLRCQPR